MAKPKRVAVRKWMMPSQREDGTCYTVSQWADGSLSCNCKAWIFKRDGNAWGCLHVSGVMAMRLAGDGVRSVAPLAALSSPVVDGERRIILED